MVARLNYAKHGEANGVVLEGGDFVHLKPDGMKKVGLEVVQEVVAGGPTRPMPSGIRAIEAGVVKGVELGPRKKPHWTRRRWTLAEGPRTPGLARLTGRRRSISPWASRRDRP